MSNMIETVEVSRQKERVLTNTENPVKIQHERADHSFLIHRIAPLQKISKNINIDEGPLRGFNSLNIQT